MTAGRAVDVADALLDVALAARANQVWIEPAPLAEDRHIVTYERDGAVLTTTTLDGELAAAVIARLALIGELDLVEDRVQRGTVTIAGPAGPSLCLVTIRPGAALRCDLLLLPVRESRERSIEVTLEPDAGLEVGVEVDHYRVQRFVGRGGMGSVYEVEHVALGRRLALKVLHRGALAHDADSTMRFLREARAASRIAHPNIVQVFDFGHVVDGRPYLVMELLTGESLAEHVARGAMTARRAIGVARQTALALAAAHVHGVVHSDVSPSNVLIVERDGGVEVKLIDFGLARLVEERLDGVANETVYGTPHYISPEQIRGDEPDARSDMYSFGAVLFEALTGEPPFHSLDVRELCMMHLTAPVPPLTSTEGTVPAGASEIVRRCLAKTPAERYPSMREVADALADVERSLDRRGWRRWLPR